MLFMNKNHIHRALYETLYLPVNIGCAAVMAVYLQINPFSPLNVKFIIWSWHIHYSGDVCPRIHMNTIISMDMLFLGYIRSGNISEVTAVSLRCNKFWYIPSSFLIISLILVYKT